MYICMSVVLLVSWGGGIFCEWYIVMTDCQGQWKCSHNLHASSHRHALIQGLLSIISVISLQLPSLEQSLMQIPEPSDADVEKVLDSYHKKVLFSSVCSPLKGGRVFLMSPPCLESQGCQIDPTFSISPLLFFFLVLSFFLCYPFLVLAHSPDLFFPKPPLCVALLFFSSSFWVVKRWVS